MYCFFFQDDQLSYLTKYFDYNFLNASFTISQST